MSIANSSIDALPRPAASELRPGGVVTLAYGIVCYAAFLASFSYLIGFVENWAVPKSIDSGAAGPFAPSLAINSALLILFGAQHSIMARPGFKRWWTRFVPKAAERSTFVLISSAILGLLYWQWRPLPTPIWQLSGVAATAATVISLAGWGIGLMATFAISHLDLFGVRQAWLRFRSATYRPVGFRLVGLYRLVRHPLMLGLLIAFWSTPTMTVGHLLFTGMMTAYILIGTRMEERDLVAEHGDAYTSYRRRVPGIVPWPKRAS